MATGTKKRRNFSPAQIRAQKAFARMAKARAKEARAAKRAVAKVAKRRPATKRAAVKRTARRNRITATVRRNGRMLYGAAAKAVLASRKRKAGPKRRGVLLTGRKKNGVFRTAARRAIASRLSKPIRFGRRRNSSTPADINRVHKMFLGRESTKSFQVKAPNGTPGNVAVLGPLVCLKTKDETFDFARGEAWVATDGQAKKLYILGDKYSSELEPNTNFGPITEIRYEARKDHINPLRWKRRRRNSQVTEYYHFFGEENGRRPRLQSDRDRLLHITGGDYKIRAEGIVN